MVAFDHLLLDPAREVAGVYAFHGLLVGSLDLRARRQWFFDALLVDRTRDVALFEHLVEHQVAAAQGGEGMDGRVVCRRRLDDAREQGGLPWVELFDAELVGRRGPAADMVFFAAEVALGGSLDPVGPVAEVDRVEVRRDDLVLRPLVRELVGESGLPELLEDRPVRLGLEGVLDELLLDRGGALDAAFVQDVLDERPGDPADVHAAVGVEALVLDRDRRLLDACGIWAGVTITRFCWLSTPIGLPRSSSRTELRASLNCAKRVSEGRSEATETNMPNTNETSPRSSRAKRIASSRTRFRRRLGGA